MKRVRLTGLLIAMEALYGQDAAPVPATHGVQLEEHIWNSIETDYVERNLREKVPEVTKVVPVD